MGTELDPSLIKSVTKKKRGERFASVRHGLNTKQVDDFLGAIVSRIEALESELHEVRATVEDPSQAADLEQPPAPSSPPAPVDEVPDHADRAHREARRGGRARDRPDARGGEGRGGHDRR